MRTCLLTFVLCLLAVPAVPADAPDEAALPGPLKSEQAAEAEAPRPGDAELEKILAKEVEVRAAIDTALEEVYKARAKLEETGMLLRSPDLPPDVKRPTADDLKKAEAGYDAKRFIPGVIYQEHLARYRAFFSLYPHHWRSHHKLAWFHADEQDSLSAAEQWRQTIALKPDFPFAYNNLATLYNHLGRDMESIDLYLKAISLKADEPEFHFNLANVLAMHRADVSKKMGWSLPEVFWQTVKHYRAARDLDPDYFEYAEAAGAQYVLAEHFEVKDWGDEAVKDWQSCLAHAPDASARARSMVGLARVQLHQKNSPEEARRLLTEAQKLDPTLIAEQMLRNIDRPPAPAE